MIIGLFINKYMLTNLTDNIKCLHNQKKLLHLLDIM